MSRLRRVVIRVVTWSLPLLGAAVGLVTAAVVVPADEPAEALAAPPLITTSTAPPFTVTTTTSTSTTTTTTAAPDPAAQPATPEPEPLEPVVPTRVRIAKIGVDANIIELGLNPDRTLEVPTRWEDTGWYTGRSVPGEVGPSVVVGHVDSAKYGPAVFYRLRELGTGDIVEIDRSDGSVAVFRISHSVLVLKSEFPTQDVYGLTDVPTLRLITCGGAFINGSHTKNLIHYAEHLGNRDPSAVANGVVLRFLRI